MEGSHILIACNIISIFSYAIMTLGCIHERKCGKEINVDGSILPSNVALIQMKSKGERFLVYFKTVLNM
jgi:hypothetical protein